MPAQVADRSSGRRSPAEAVRGALLHPEALSLAVQPIVDLATGEVAGYEALARLPASWDVGPDAFMAEAHRTGHSAPLQALVCAAVVELLPSLPSDTFLTCNVDPSDLATDEAVGPLLEQRSLSRLVVEVTERAWPADPAPVDAALARLRGKGALVAADDVGAGYAGLTQLMRLRPDLVKVDRGLIEHLGTDPAAELLVKVLGELCSHLDAWVVVEGVETETQLAALARLGVPLGQGWLLGRPAGSWTPSPARDLVRRRAAMAVVDETIAPLVDTVPVPSVRDDVGRWWLLTDGGMQPATTMAPSTSVVEAAARAVARPPGQRWDPVLVTSRTGGVIGHVPVEALVLALTRTPRA